MPIPEFFEITITDYYDSNSKIVVQGTFDFSEKENLIILHNDKELYRFVNVTVRIIRSLHYIKFIGTFNKDQRLKIITIFKSKKLESILKYM